MAPSYSLTRLGGQAEPKEKPKERKGISRFLFGKSGIDPLGISTLGREIWQAGGSLTHLGASLAPGGVPAGEAWSQAGKGFGKSLAGTAIRLTPGVSQLAGGLGLHDDLRKWGIEPDLMKQISERGLASALFEDVGNLALGAGTVKSFAMRAGNAATKATVAGHMLSEAARPGIAATKLQRAQGIGRELGEAGRITGARGALKAEGLRGPRMRQVARSEQRLARAGGRPAAAGASQLGSRVYKASSAAAHPYRELFRGVIRPSTIAASRARIAGVAPEITDATLPRDVADLRGAGATADDLAYQAAAEAMDKANIARKTGAAKEVTTAEQMAGVETRQAAALKPAADAASEAAAKSELEASLAADGAILPRRGPAADQLLAAKDAPSPAWAERLAEKAGPRGREFMDKLEGRFKASEARTVYHETRRFMGAERRKLFNSPAVTSSKAAIDKLVESGVNRREADVLVGDTLMSMLENREFLRSLVESGAAPELAADPGFLKHLDHTIDHKYRMTSAQRALVADELAAALDEWTELQTTRKQMLLGSPGKGYKGLEDIEFDPAAFDPIDTLSPAQQKKFSKLMREYEDVSGNMNPERRAQATRAKEALASVSGLDRALRDLERMEGALTDAQRAVIEQALPPTLRGPARQATVNVLAERILSDAPDGTLDLHTGQWVGKADADAAVGVAGTRVPLAEFQANPAAIIEDFVSRYASLLTDKDAKIGARVENGEVFLDVSQTTINGRRMSREEAVILGTARGEISIYDFQRGDVHDLARDHTSMVIASQHAVELQKAGGQFTRYLRHVTKTRQGLEQLQTQGAIAGALVGAPFELRLDPQAWEGALRMHMRFATTGVGTGRFKSLDQYWGQMAADFNKTGKLPTDAMRQVYLNPNVETAMRNLPGDFQRALRQVGDEGRDSLNWYFDAHDTIAQRYAPEDTVTLPRRRMDPETGETAWVMEEVSKRDLVWSILAVSSVNAGPISNAHTAFTGLMAYDEFAKGLDIGAVMDAFDGWHSTVAKDLRLGPRAGGIAKLSPEALANELWAAVGSKIPHTGKVAADVFDILSDRLVGEWDSQWLFERAGKGAPATAEDAARVLAGPKASVKKIREVAENQIPDNWDELVEASRQGDQAAEAKIANVLGSKGYAKIRNFFANMQDPHKNRGVTLDRVMAQAYGLNSEDWSGVVYDQVVQLLDGAARDLSELYGVEILPHQIQALQWIAAKQEFANIEIGRRRAARMDLAEAFDDVEVTEAMLNEGADPISKFYAGRAELEGRGMVGRVQETVSETGARETKRFHETVAKGEGAAASKAWDARKPRIIEALKRGDRTEAESILDAWLAEEAADFSDMGGYYSQYTDLAGKQPVYGVGDTIAGSATAARESRWLPDRTVPTDTPPTAAGLHDLTEAELAALARSVQARVDEVMGSDGPAMLQRVTDDLANGATFKDKTGHIVTRFFRTADPTTLLHEAGHVLRLILNDAEIATLREAYRGPKRKVTPPGVRTRQAKELVGQFGDEAFEERFVHDLLTHMNTGTAPAGLEDVFGQLQSALASWWEGTGESFDRALLPEVTELFNQYLDPYVGNLEIRAPRFGRDLDTLSPKQIARGETRRPGEGPKEAFERGKKLGAAAERAQKLAADVATQRARVSKMEEALESVIDTLNEIDLPPEALKQRRLDRAAGKMGTMLRKADDPVSWESALPPTWKPIGAAMDRLHKSALTDPVYGRAIAEILAEMPDTLTGFFEYAASKGFSPTHISHIPEGKVRQLVWGRFAPGDVEIEAGARKTRSGGFPLARSVGALMAAQLDVVRESHTGAFLDTIKRSMAQPLAEGAEIPSGWVEWDAVQRYMGVDVDEAGIRRAVSPGAPRFMVPEAVANTIRHQNRNLDIGVLRGLRKITNPWRAVLLTFTPRWYVNNVVGNMILATTQGVRLADWAHAWQDVRQDSRFNDMLERRFGGGQGLGDEIRGTATVTSDLALEGLGRTIGYRGARASGRGRVTSANEARMNTMAKLQRMNSVVDDLARTAVFYASKGQGYTDEAALQRAMTSLVDYEGLGPAERALVRSVVPFYTWQKGILKIAAKLPVDHTARMGIMHQLGRLQDELLSDLPEYYRDIVNVPGLGTISPRALNPFQDSLALMSSEGILNSMNPLVESVLRSATGASESGYPEQFTIDRFGRRVPSVDPSTSLMDIFAGLPQVRAASQFGEGGMEAFLGRPTRRSPEQLQAARERLTKSEAAQRGESLAEPRGPSARTKLKRFGINLPEAPLAPRPRLPDLGL